MLTGPSGPASIQILTINACSLISYQKRHALNSLLRSTKPDICLIQESRLNSRHRLSFPNYDLIRYDSSPGIIIAHLSNINCQAFSLPPGLTSVSGACVVSSNSSKILVVCLYARCNSIEADYRSDLDAIKSAGAGFDQILIGGDFNARHPFWNNPTANSMGNALFNFSQANPDLSIIYPPNYTLHNHPSTIDLFLSDLDYTSIRTITTTFSDHLAVSLFISIPHPLDTIQITKPIIYNKINWPALQSNLHAKFSELIPSLPNTRNLTNIEIDTQLQQVSEILCNAISSLPSASHLPYYLSNVDDTTACLLKEKALLRKQIRACYSKYSNVAHPHYITLKSLLKRCSNLINTNLRNHINNTFANRLAKIKPGPNMFREIRAFSNSHAQLPEFQFNGSQCIAISDKLAALAQHFHNCSTPPPSNNTNPALDIAVAATIETLSHSATITPTFGPPSILHPLNISSTVTTFSINNPSNHPTTNTDIFFSTPETAKLILRLKNKKSSDFSNLSPFFLRKIANELAPVLSIILNNSINNQYFPSALKCSKIIPISKKSDNMQTADSFRPISMVPTLGKVFELALHSQLINHLEQTDIMPSCQFGFIHQCSTFHPLLKFTSDTLDAANRSEVTAACLLDLRKAFDSVWHHGLIFKLIQLKFPISLCRSIYSYLSNRSFYVANGHHKSATLQIGAGVPQGSIISPILFNIYSADIPTDTPNTTTLLYADDAIVYSSSQMPSAANARVSRAIETINKFYKDWRLTLNPAKSEYILLNTTTKHTSRAARAHIAKSTLTIDGTILKPADSVVYLGVKFVPNLSFSPHITHRLALASKALNILRPLMRKKSLSTLVKSLLYIQIIRPVFSYAFPIWCNSNLTAANKLLAFERNAIRYVTGLWRNAFHPDLHFIPYYKVWKKAKIKSNLSTFLTKLAANHAVRLRSHPNPIISDLLANHSHTPLSSDFILPLNYILNPDQNNVFKQALCAQTLSPAPRAN